jgi:hypothetical protein
VLIDNDADAQALATEVPLATATLHFRGYPKQIDLEQRRSGLRLRSREFDGAIPASARQLHAHGRCDGPCEGQSTTAMRSSAAARRLRRSSMCASCRRCLRIGSATTSSTRTDYVKDMDWWDASPFTVAQLPFHKMSTYPYPVGEKFPDDAAR